MDEQDVISSVRVYREPRDGQRARVKVWNRGGLAGELVVGSKDAGTIAARLFGDLPVVVSLANPDVGRDYDLFEVDEERRD